MCWGEEVGVRRCVGEVCLGWEEASGCVGEEWVGVSGV